MVASMFFSKMATKSFMQLTGAAGGGNWSPSRDLGSYNSMTARFSEEELADLAFMSNRGSIFGNWRDSVPNRSGSAPPSMEGSLAALNHFTGQQSGNFGVTLQNLRTGVSGSESEDHICYNPACGKNHGSKVNLNPRERHHLMNQFSRVEERMLFSHDDGISRSLLVGCSTLSTHKEEPEDEKSPRLDSSSAEDAQCDSAQSTSNLGGCSPNLVNSIKENFPRSNDLYGNSSEPFKTNCGDGGLIYCGINSSKNSTIDGVKSSYLNEFPLDTHRFSPRPIGSPVSNKLTSGSLPAASPPTSSCSDHNTSIEACQQRNPSMAVKPGETVDAMLDSLDSSMKNMNVSLDTLRSSHVMQQWQNNALLQNGLSNLVNGDPVPMVPQGINLPQIPPVDNSTFGHMKLYSGDVQLIPQIRMTTPFCTPSSFGVPYYPNLQSPSVWAPPLGIGGYGLPGSFLPPVMTNFAPHLPVMAPFDTSLPSFSGRVAGFPSAGNLAAGTELFDPYKIYEHLGVAMPPPIPDQSLLYYFQQPSIHQYGGGNPYTMVSSSNFVGNPAGVFGSQITHPSENRFQLPVTGAANASTPRKGRKSVGNFKGTSPDFGIQIHYPASPVLHGQPASRTYPHDRRNNVMGFQYPSQDMPASSGMQGQRGRAKSDDPKARFLAEELMSSRTRKAELSDIKGQLVKYSTDQNGSRFIQQKLENCTTEEKALVFAEILPHASTLMTDVFGNYVIQKALEVIDLEQKIGLVRELDGHGQAAKLSMHPYGCRVIQRTLEHCSKNSEGIIDEILPSACMLAQDQYGNYVMQHILEKGNDHVRGQIITRLAGQVVSMSQSKYASNVIEKCFKHGDGAERDLLIKEILEQTEGNNCLLAMMKDKYGNYVIQKMLETCNEQQKEVLVSRVKCHLPLLRKYTYGKHIISRVEHLCDDGEFICQFTPDPSSCIVPKQQLHTCQFFRSCAVGILDESHHQGLLNSPQGSKFSSLYLRVFMLGRKSSHAIAMDEW
ncbi:hypothetical protein GUJ93_ZPchr0002g26038 [Zizania palustris]|uniref:PUM-HD domain-containing protein n=1 Tax=Zizania palustris TaxID=103762 RepID=A0A8J5VEV5_ZIZPA|nr:hypothetical protein GUJ93_ZPchr0002g26038 [Zizania palustris]